MQFDPELWLRIRDKKVTPHQIKILSEIANTHSQTKAARNLGISVPVLHRHLKGLTAKLGLNLVQTTANGTWLTTEGRLLLRIYDRYQEMLAVQAQVSIYCTPISYELVNSMLLDFEIKGQHYRVSMNDDQQNLRALYLGRADLVIFDDPIFAMEFEGLEDEQMITTDLFNDTLVHINKGRKYIKFKYGAQRLGFRYLEANGIEYRIIHELSDFNYIKRSKYSYFMNRSYLDSCGIKINGYSNRDIDTEMLKHPIMAVSINPTVEVREIIKNLRDIAVEISNKAG